LNLIVFSVDFLPNIGGISTMTHHLANALGECGCNVLVVSPNKETEFPGYQRRYKLFNDIDARPRVREGEAYAEEFDRIRGLCAKLHGEKFKFDHAIVSHPFYYGPGVAGFCLENKIPYSVFCYAFEIKSLLNQRGRSFRLKRALGLVGERDSIDDLTFRTYRDASTVFAISRYSAGLACSFSLRDRVVITGCGVSDEDIARRPRELPEPASLERLAGRERFGIPTNCLVLGTLCRLMPSKNVEMLIRAVARNRSAVGVIVGKGPEKEKLLRLASELGCEDRLYWFENVSETDKWALLACMDIFCLLSRETREGQVEGFGIVLLEAALAGVPVVGTRSGGIPDVIENGVSGSLVDVDDDEALDACIEKVALDDDYAIKLVSNMKRSIEEKFNWKEVSKIVIDQIS